MEAQASDAQAALAQRVAFFAHQGWRVESQTDRQCVLVKGKRPNHILHLLLTVFTFLLWAPVWVVLSITSKEHRMVLTVDESGEVRGA